MTNEVAGMILEYVPHDELINSAIVTASNAADGAFMFACITGIILIVIVIIGIFGITNRVVHNWLNEHDFVTFILLAFAVFSFIGAISGAAMNSNYNCDLEKLQSDIEPIQITTALKYYNMN